MPADDSPEDIHFVESLSNPLDKGDAPPADLRSM